MPDPLDLWQLPFARTALAELLLLALAAGLVGAWVVLRRRAFFTHAVGAATFPGLVVAAAAGFSAPAAALAVAAAYAAGVAWLGRSRSGSGQGDEGQLATGLLLVAALGAGIVLASDVFVAGAEVDRLLFGTLLGLGGDDLGAAGAAAALAVAATVVLGRAWTAVGFDGTGGSALPMPAALADGLLLALIAAVAVAVLPAVGALLATALLIVPAATTRLFAGSVPALLAWTPLLAAAEAVAALYGALWLDVPPGPILAVLGSAVYLAAALARGLRSRSPVHLAAETRA